MDSGNEINFGTKKGTEDKFLMSMKLFEEDNLKEHIEIYEQNGTGGIYVMTNGAMQFACPYVKFCHNNFYCGRKLIKEQVEHPYSFNTFVSVNTEGDYGCLRNLGYVTSTCEAKDIREYEDCEWYDIIRIKTY